jgi:hypothetical protein
MKRTVIIAPFLLLTFAYALFAQTPPQMPKPLPEHQRLRYFVGNWETAAEAKPSPFGPGGKITARDHNEMFGDFFVVFHSDSTGPMGQQKNVAVMGYDPKERSTHTTGSPRRESATKQRAPSRETPGCGHSAAKNKESHSKGDST